MMIIPLAPPSLAESSDLPGDCGRAVRMTSPYLVLLRAGFCLPPVLPRARCALTAPFHPYPSTRARLTPGARSGQASRLLLLYGPALSERSMRVERESKGGMFSVPLSFRLP